MSEIGAGELRAERVSKSFGKRQVLSEVSICVQPGKVHAVLGPSGAGKSTLLRILNLLEVPDAGTVSWGGTPIALSTLHGRLSAPQREARLAMALVPQKPIAFRQSVFENVAYGLRLRALDEGEIEKRVRAALERLGIATLADAQARRLSGGETQRLAFARATVLPLKFLLLDEFTANLDPPNVKALEGAVAAAARDQGLGVLFVTHDLFQARRIADEVSLVWDGRLIESAPKSEFFESPQDPRARAFVAGELVV